MWAQDWAKCWIHKSCHVHLHLGALRSFDKKYYWSILHTPAINGGRGRGEAGRGVKTNVLHSLWYRYSHIGIGYYMPTLRLKLRSYIQHVGYEHDYKSVNNFFASFFIYNFSSRFRRWIRRIECPWPKGYGCLDKQTVFLFFSSFILCSNLHTNFTSFILLYVPNTTWFISKSYGKECRIMFLMGNMWLRIDHLMNLWLHSFSMGKLFSLRYFTLWRLLLQTLVTWLDEVEYKE